MALNFEDLKTETDAIAGESYGSSPDEVMRCINDIRSKLDALEAAVSGGENQAEPEPEIAPPVQSDDEVAAGIPPRPKMPMFGGR